VSGVIGNQITYHCGWSRLEARQTRFSSFNVEVLGCFPRTMQVKTKTFTYKIAEFEPENAATLQEIALKSSKIARSAYKPIHAGRSLRLRV
jgi:hypothetical protein